MHIMNSHRKILYPFNTLDYNDKRGTKMSSRVHYTSRAEQPNEMKVNNNVNRF